MLLTRRCLCLRQPALPCLRSIQRTPVYSDATLPTTSVFVCDGCLACSVSFFVCTAIDRYSDSNSSSQRSATPPVRDADPVLDLSSMKNGWPLKRLITKTPSAVCAPERHRHGRRREHARTDRMREHWNRTLAGQAFFSGFTGLIHFTCDLC